MKRNFIYACKERSTYRGQFLRISLMVDSKSADLLYRIATKTDSEYRKYGKKFFNYALGSYDRASWAKYEETNKMQQLDVYY